MRKFCSRRNCRIFLNACVAACFLLVFTGNLTAATAGGNNSVSSEEMQGISVRGVVRDAATNETMPGVNIKVAGTALGAITDAEGRYSFASVDRNATLSFSFIGYVTQDIALNGRTSLDVTMESELLGLNEVVVVGYGSAVKRNVASATSALKSDEIVGLSTTDPRQVLQGKIAGVQVTNNSGDPGSGARIVIRGMGSFSNTDPLYVIDGIQGGDINSVAPQDIENITILKDASTTAIYGSAAANGVVLITTKSGRRGDLKVEYEGSAGFANVVKRLDMLNASEYVDLVTDIQHSNGLEITAKLQSPDVRVDRTDWQAISFQRGFVTDHNLRFSGGTENVTYAFSAGYQNQESTVIDRTFQRVTIGAKLSETLFNKRVTLNQNLRVKHDINNGVLASLNEALRMAPYLPVYDPTNLGGYARMDKVTDLQDANNPMNTIGNTDYNDRSLGMELDLSGEIQLVKGLSFRSQGRISGGNNHNMTFNYPCNGGNFNRATSDINEYYNYDYGFILENYFSFNRTFGVHALTATLGNTYAPAGIYRSISASGSDYTSDAIQNLALANSTSVTGSSVNSGKSRLSYFGRLGYTYKGKYVLNASLRRDASSVFGVNNRWGTFYGLGVAWTISEEEFLKSASSVSNLKLRASFGKTGNDNIPAFLTSSSVWKGSGNNIVYSFGDDLSFATGSIVNSVPNPNLKWEETTQFDIGFDLGLLKDRIAFTFDYYNRSNKDLLIETQLPLTTGLGNPGSVGTQWINAASMKNSGFEASLTYNSNPLSAFRWNISLNTTYSINEVTALGTVGDLPISKGEFMTGVGNATRTDIGHPLGSYYGYVYDHVIVDQADLDALNEAADAATDGEVTEYQVNAKPGDRVWKDIDGNGYINADDRTYIGNPSPKWQYGVAFNAFFKNFDLQLLMHGVAGVDAVNGSLYWWEGMSKPFNQTATVLTRWKEPGDVTDIPRAGQNSGANLNFSTWYVEKGDYLRVKNIALGYTLPANLFNTFEKFRVYVSIQNALTLTKYSGFDPEISSTSPGDNNNYIFQRGIDMYQRPNPRIMRLGVQLTF